MAPLLLGHSQLYLLLSLLLLASHVAISTGEDPLYEICENTRNYTANSTFQSNLGLLLTHLLSGTPATGFSNDTVGRRSDRVHGLALCRGDLTQAQCQGCLADAVDGVVKVCPYRKSATVWYETCHLRYSDKSFFGSPSRAQLYMFNMNNVSDPASFNRGLRALFDGLTKRAAHGSPSRMFAAGDVNAGGGSGKIYGLVQCTRDLSARDCDRCLREEIDQIPKCCDGKQGGRVIGGSCYLRYEVSPFYNATAAAAEQLPALPPARPPLPPAMAMSPTSTSVTTPVSPSPSAATVNEPLMKLTYLVCFLFLLLVIG